VTRRRVRARCHDCHLDTLDMPGGGPYHLNEYYMVHDHVWAAAGMSEDGGFLCVGCLSRRLGRHLDSRDLTAAACNRPDAGDTPRMYALKLAAALARFRAGEPGW
jgi:hypothetical protein